jgi:hypothetical protein
MKATINWAIAASLVALLPVGIAAAQVNVTAPGPAGGVNVQAGPGGANVAVPPGTGAAIRDNAAIRQDNRIDRRATRQAERAANENWRMVNHQNRWWYYHPNNSWSYYQGGRWNAWQEPGRQLSTAQPGANQPNRYQSGYRGLAPSDNRNNILIPDTNNPAGNLGPAPARGGTLPGNGTLPDNDRAPGNDRTPASGK